MNDRPYRSATLLALATILGLVGLMLVEGWWAAPFGVLAAGPMALGLWGYARAGRWLRLERG